MVKPRVWDFLVRRVLSLRGHLAILFAGPELYYLGKMAWEGIDLTCVGSAGAWGMSITVKHGCTKLRTCD